MEKIAVISGASSGIGLACARLFTKNGYKVYNLSRSFVSDFLNLKNRRKQSKNPPVYVVGGFSYKILVGLSKILPKRLVNFLIGKLYG